MLKRIQFKNFRKHTAFSIHCRKKNVIVGPNNAGKSTVLDGLRIFADIQNFAESRKPVLKSKEKHGVCACYEITNSSFSINILNIAKNYSDDYAIVNYHHESGNQLVAKLHPDKSPDVFIASESAPQKNTRFFKKCFPENVVVVPTLGQFEETERLHNERYVRQIENTRLAARNFRNIWRLKPHSEFVDFAEVVSESWPGIEIGKPQREGLGDDLRLLMPYSEGGVEREVYWSGFGFQVWLQIMTHILRGGANDILVLDEPETYLHADLQRKLYQLVDNRFKQTFIATHSSEMMNEANAGDVFLLKPGAATAQRVRNDDGYRDAYALLGSSENADFARLARARRVVAYEGNDRVIYRRIEKKLVSDGGILSDGDTLFVKIGGFEQWRKVENLNWMFQDVFGIEAKIFSIFDRDYRCDADIFDHIKKIEEKGIACRVLARKEIENYLIDDEPLFRTIFRLFAKQGRVFHRRQFNDLVKNISQSMKEDAKLRRQTTSWKYDKERGDSRDEYTISKAEGEQFDSKWSENGHIELVSGKAFLARLNREIQETHGVSLTIARIIDGYQPEEFAADLVSLVSAANDYFEA